MSTYDVVGEDGVGKYADANVTIQMNQLFEIPTRSAMVRATLHDTSLP